MTLSLANLSRHKDPRATLLKIFGIWYLSRKPRQLCSFATSKKAAELSYNQSKCAVYYEDNDFTLDKISVSFKKKKQLSKSLTHREFEVTDGENSTNVSHFHFATWADHGVPKLTDFLDDFDFIYKILASNIDSSEGPSIVHCSAGVGRTGTFLAIFTQIYRILNDFDGYLNIGDTVFDLKKQRYLMVQTEEQYKFIFDAVLGFLKNKKPL